MNAYILFGAYVLVSAAAIGVLVWLARLRNAPNRERIERMRIQGNFVPLSPDDRAEDEARVARRAANRGGL